MYNRLIEVQDDPRGRSAEVDDGCSEASESQRTEIVEEEHYLSRPGELASGRPRNTARRHHRSKLSGHKPHPLPSPAHLLPSTRSDISSDRVMAESMQPTQPATQPYDDPRRFGRNLSDMSEDDATDVICLLHANSQAAFSAVQATILAAPEHILQNDDLDGVTEEDFIFSPALQQTRDFALRMSSTVHKPQDGFRFGRNPDLCDVLLTGNKHDKLISNVHFKIFVNSQGSLMLQDTSTNGTIVDDDHLRHKGKDGRPMNKPAMRALKNGAIICVLGEPGRSEIKLMVRIPNRGDFEDRYEAKLRKYLEVRGRVANFASMRENSLGNHWNGGAMYNFTGTLGKGAFATVYRVQTKNEGTVYAAKELDKRRFVKNGILDLKFDSELKIMQDLKHPNIVEYIDCQTYQNWIYIIMEVVPWGELSKELHERKSKRLPEVEVQQIARQIMHALEYLHRRGITHRDIKPDNILIASRDPLVVKLSDFGLSKCIGDQETFLKTFCGTLLYCAPEVYPDYGNYTQGPTVKRRRFGEPAPKTSPYDQSVDMWSFGAVLFHLLCGKAPIMGRGDDRGAQMLNNIMTKEVDFEPLRSVGASEEAVDFIHLLLNRNPMLRPKEKECFQHPWLKDVPDLFDYRDSREAAIAVQRRLEAVEELDEDLLDEELMMDLNKLTQAPLSSDPMSQRPVKRAKMGNSETGSQQILYPQLPGGSSIPSQPGTIAPGERLFGEITPSLLRSSGVFGQQVPLPPTTADVPDIRHAIEHVSVNDYATFDGPLSTAGTDVSGGPMQYPNALELPTSMTGPAPSLLGAEAQIGQLNMASPEAAPSDAPTPDTTNPITPNTRELSPSASVGKASEEETPSQKAARSLKFSRRVDMDLLNNEAAFAANLQAREASRADRRRMMKAETFHTQPNTTTHERSVELARTIDARTGREVQSQGPARTFVPFNRTINLPRVAMSAQDSHGQAIMRYGKLTPTIGSFTNQVVNLEARMTIWGRGLDCTVQYPDVKDTRVPKFAIKILFWAPGMEAHIERGQDWTQIPGVRTLISTSATRCIWVNGVELRKETVDGDAALFGKLYSGDVITVHEATLPGEYLRFQVEITFGDSARPRPEAEAGFQTQMERSHHKKAKARESMRLSSSGDFHEAATTVSTDAGRGVSTSASSLTNVSH